MTHDRFKRSVWAFKANFTGALAKWLVRQSPYVVPDNLSVCIEKFHAQLDSIAEFEIHGMAQRGGSVSCTVRIGKVSGPLVPSGTADAIVSSEPIEALRYIFYSNNKKGKLFLTCFSNISLSSGSSLRIVLFSLSNIGSGILSKNLFIPFYK